MKKEKTGEKKKGKAKWIVIAVIAVIVVGGIAGGGSKSDKPDADNKSVVSDSGSEQSEETEEVKTDSEPLENDDSAGNSEKENDKSEDAAPKLEERVLYEDSTAKITLTGLESGLFGTELKVKIENLSGKTICVQSRNVSINGIMVEPMFSAEVAAGKTANDELTFSNLEKNRIDKIGNIELSFHVLDYDTFDKIVDTEQISIVVDESVSDHKNDEGTPVYEAEGIKISYIGKISSDYSKGFDFVIENNSDKAYTVQARELSVDSVMFDPTFSAEVMPGKIIFDDMTFYDENFPDDPKSLELKFHIYESDSLETGSDTDVITIDVSK